MSLEHFTGNQKTILSIDFDRDSTCKQRCDYCYVNNMERIYPAYLAKITRNSRAVEKDPQEFAQRLNDEYWKSRKSKSKQFENLSKLPIRMYGSGDFIPEHIEFIKELKFPFYMISKNLTTPELSSYIPKLLSIPNLTNLRLSFDADNLPNYHALKSYYNKDRVGFCYTGLAHSFQKAKDDGFEFNMFYNISHKKTEIKAARVHKERCLVDTDDLKLREACVSCNRCWQSSKTKESNWNRIQSVTLCLYEVS